MKTFRSLAAAMILSGTLTSAAEVPAPKDAGDQAAWAALAARFETPPAVKSDGAKTVEIAVSGVRGKAAGAGSAAITVEKAGGRVIEVTSNSANFDDDAFAQFANFHELRALTLFHNAGYTPAGLARLATLPKLERLTLAGGSLTDAGMAELAKLPTLRELRAWHCPFSDNGVAAFRGHPALESIQIGPNWEPLLTDKTLEYLAECPKLKKLTLNETWLTWEAGLRHLVKRKGQITNVDLGKCLIVPAEVDRLRTEMAGTKVEWAGLAAAGQDFSKKIPRTRAERWIPKALIDEAVAAAGGK